MPNAADVFSVTGLEITQDLLKKIYNYDPLTGVLTTAVRTSNISRIGAEVGRAHTAGYLVVGLGDKIYLAHRLIWLRQTGKWPKEVLDHINMNPADNRLTNLRECSQACNTRNQVTHIKTLSGAKGVARNGKGWMASVMVDRVRKYLGTYGTIEEAKKVRDDYARIVHGEFFRS
jgi:hypothetical protein